MLIAGPKEEALEVLSKWRKAFSDSDVDAMVKLYAADTTFMGASSKTLLTKTSEIHSYFQEALLQTRPRSAKLGDHSVVVVSDTVVVVTGLDTVTGVRDGQPYSNAGRITFVVAKRGSDWKIVHLHRSAIPK